MAAPMPESLAACGTEHGNQAALFCWMALNQKEYPELKLAFAVPNGGSRNKVEAARLKAEGVKAGVPDIFLPVARHGVYGLFLELKRPSSVGKSKGKLSEEQAFWIDELQKQGYGACAVIGWEQARDVLVRYLS